MNRASELLIGRIALRLGHLQPRQLEKAIEKQRGNPKALLGEVFVRQGYMTLKALEQCLAEQQRLLAVPPKYGSIPRVEETFGHLCVRHGLVTAETVEDFLCLQARLVDRFACKVPLGLLMAEVGVLEAEQVEQILAFQRKRILHCRNCGSWFNAALYEDGLRFRCGKCKGRLEVPEGELELAVDGEVLTADSQRIEDEDLPFDLDTEPVI